jgi:hypothetical protein
MLSLLPADPVTVGDFELLARLGAGGMGQLYLGRRPDGPAAAVKLIRPDLAHQPDFRARFRREIAAAEQAGSAYTARVVAADPDGNPPWLAAEYLPGPSLAEAVGEHGKLPETTVRTLLAGLCAGLVHLHGLGLVHRDLKPGNVLLTADGPRIIDFGVSRVLDSSTITQTGQLLGSPGFMAPEQALGSDTAGPPIDIFALGALISYALTGASPFGTGQTPAVVYRVVHEQPRLDAVPESLRDLVAECLAKDPADRPTAQHLLDRLAPGGPAVAGRWLPEYVVADIRRREAELAALDQPQREECSETMLRPRPTPAPAPTPASTGPTARRRGRGLVLAGVAVAVVLAAAGGTALAVRSGKPTDPVATRAAAADLASFPPASASADPISSVAPSASAPAAVSAPSNPAAGPTPAAEPSTVIAVRPGVAEPTATDPVTRATAAAKPRATPKATPAQAVKPVKDGPSCFGTAIGGAFELQPGVTVAGGPNYAASGKCRDIHIKLTSALYRTYARSCLETANGSSITKCSSWILLSYPDTWDTMSTSVPAGSRWQLQMYAQGDESARFFYSA